MKHQNPNTAISNRDAFLAAHPKIKRVQNAIADKYNRYQHKVDLNREKIARLKVDTINHARQAGEMGIELLELAWPGKQMTLDLWDQVAGDGKHKFHGSFKDFRLFTVIAAKLDKDITSLSEAEQKFLEQILNEETERKEQHRVGPTDEFGFILGVFDKFTPELLKSFQANPNYFQAGKPLLDFREHYRLQLKPKFLLMQEFDRMMEAT